MLAEIIQDPALFITVRAIVDGCRRKLTSDEIDFDFEKLFNDPLLQSIYAETLRLRVAVFLMRSPDHNDLDLKGWRLPKNSPILVSSYHAQMNEEAWGPNAGQQHHPLEEFWAQRFLKSPTYLPNMSSRKGRSSEASRDSGMVSHESTDTPHLQFSLEERTGHWLPYGGGQRTCPGRFFAKQEMLSGLAIIITMFDIEVLDKNRKLPKSDMGGFGFGTLSPDRDMPVRIRKRSWK